MWAVIILESQPLSVSCQVSQSTQISSVKVASRSLWLLFNLSDYDIGGSMYSYNLSTSHQPYYYASLPLNHPPSSFIMIWSIDSPVENSACHDSLMSVLLSYSGAITEISRTHTSDHDQQHRRQALHLYTIITHIRLRSSLPALELPPHLCWHALGRGLASRWRGQLLCLKKWIYI